MWVKQQCMKYFKMFKYPIDKNKDWYQYIAVSC